MTLGEFRRLGIEARASGDAFFFVGHSGGNEQVSVFLFGTQGVGPAELCLCEAVQDVHFEGLVTCGAPNKPGLRCLL